MDQQSVGAHQTVSVWHGGAVEAGDGSLVVWEHDGELSSHHERRLWNGDGRWRRRTKPVQSTHADLICGFGAGQNAVGLQHHALLQTHVRRAALAVDVAWFLSPVRVRLVQGFILIHIGLADLPEAAERLRSLAGRRAALAQGVGAGDGQTAHVWQHGWDIVSVADHAAAHDGLGKEQRQAVINVNWNRTLFKERGNSPGYGWTPNHTLLRGDYFWLVCVYEMLNDSSELSQDGFSCKWRLKQRACIVNFWWCHLFHLYVVVLLFIKYKPHLFIYLYVCLFINYTIQYIINNNT